MTRTLAEALAVLGLEPGQGAHELRQRQRELLRTNHPDVASAEISSVQANEITIAVNEAVAIVIAAIEAGDGVSIPSPPAPAPADLPRPPVAQEIITVEIDSDGDTLRIDVPPPEAFAMLLEAGATLGGIGYVDRGLGLLELIVRFEEGPSCSVLLTMQGRAFGTDIFVTMESIEAAPTPALAPVVDALLEALAARQ